MSRLTACLALLAFSAVSHAAWTATLLSPNSPNHVYARDGFGQIQVGYFSASQTSAALWSGTAASYVNMHPAGATASEIYQSNGSLHVGAIKVSNLYRAGYWSGTSNSFQHLTNSIHDPSFAFGIDGNTQVGSITVDSIKHAAMWTGTIASLVDLHPANATQSSASAVGGGMQGGSAQIAGKGSAVIWSGTAASAVNLHPAGFASSAVEGMSATNQVGWGLVSFSFHALLWSGTAGSMVDLHPAGAQNSIAYATNGTYQVGEVMPQGGQSRAAIWQGTAASVQDLHSALPADYTMSTAYSVWQDGAQLYVAGTATNDTTGFIEAVLWRLTDPSDFSLVLNKAQVAGQNSVQGTIAADPQPQSRVYTTYDNSSLVTTPPSVTLAANASTKNFQITVAAVNSTINTTIFAKYGSTTRSAPLALVPLVPTALAFTPSTVTGGSPTSCRVVINGVAGPGGRTIAILDNSPYATVPSTVTVPPGGTQVIFNIATTAVPSQKTVTVTARVSAGEKTGSFKINP